MAFNIIVTFVLISSQQITSTHTLNVLQNRKELIEIIRSLNNPEAAEIMEEANKRSAGNSKGLPDAAKERILQEVVKLIKKNYNANLQYKEMMKNPMHSGSRLHFIKNPQVLEEYKNYLRKRDDSTSGSDDASSEERVTKFSEWRNAKRRTDSKLESIEIDDNNDREMKTDETNDKIGNLSAENNDKTNLNDLRISNDNAASLELTKEEKEIDSIEAQNKRAQDSRQSDNIVRREKIQWSNSNEKVEDNKEKKKKLKINNKEPKKIKHNYIDRFETTFKAPKFEPKITYRRPKSDRHKDFVAFGRTSIPFIGKKGIYEDK